MYGETRPETALKPRDRATTAQQQQHQQQPPLVSVLKKRNERKDRLPSFESEALSTPVSTDSELQVETRNTTKFFADAAAFESRD